MLFEFVGEILGQGSSRFEMSETHDSLFHLKGQGQGQGDVVGRLIGR